MSRVRVEIDLNSRDRNGLTRTRIRNASGPIQRGQIVTAYESEDEVQALAYVDRVDDAAGYAFLFVNWDSMQDDDGTDVQSPEISTHAVNRAQASVANSRAANAAASRTTFSGAVHVVSSEQNSPQHARSRHRLVG